MRSEVNSGDAPFIIENVRLFDGERSIPHASVVVADGVIAAMGEAGYVAAPKHARIDGRAQTLLPGLIDSHTHAWGPLEKVLARALLFGVTTELEMECDGDGLVEANALRKIDPPHLAQLRSSGFPVTVSGGHGTEYGFPVPVVDSVDGIDAFIEARIAEGSDYIKLIFNDDRFSAATLPREMLRAAIHAAHARSRRTIVHVSTLRTAREAIEDGADGLAHVFPDKADADFGEFVWARRAFVVPTLTVQECLSGTPSGAAMLDDDRVAPFLSSFDRRQLALTPEQFDEDSGLPPRTTPAGWAYAHAALAVGQLMRAGVPILAGTDAPNPGTTHGASMHRELELLVDAGLTPLKALAAATSVPARSFGLDDRGRIAPGLRADLLLVRGDPTADITATRDIVGVWKAGVRLARTPR